MRLFFILFFCVPSLCAAPRLWKDADSDRTVRGEFVSRDDGGITIRLGDRRTVNIPYERLHAFDIAWLDQHHPLPKPLPVALLDTISFGDTRGEVLAKLRASELVELTVNEVYLARVGLNGVFRTHKEIGGLFHSLSFDWTEDGSLSEITLESVAPDDEADPKHIRSCWQKLVKLLTEQHGNPIQAAAYPDPAHLKPGIFLANHLWRLADGGTLLLGSSRSDSGFSTTVRYTTETIEPDRVP